MYKIGDIISGKVTGIENYGIFVKIDSLYDGLIHISEVSEEYVKNIYDYVRLGEIVYCQILDIDKATLQMKLSIKDINYKEDITSGIIKETRRGFLPLKENLDGWLKEKLKEYKY